LPKKKRHLKTPSIDWDRLEGAIEYLEFRPYIVGVVERCGLPPVLCYDRSLVLDHLTREIGDADDATEHFEFNILGGYLGPTTPFFLDRSVVAEVG
jgi:hypothetical protein